jgi:hypothetical protein
MANEESRTPIWFALKLSQSTFGVFDAFEDEASRQAHLQGPIAQALMAKAEELFAVPPSIEAIEVLGLKNAALLRSPHRGLFYFPRQPAHSRFDIRRCRLDRSRWSANDSTSKFDTSVRR